MKTTKLLIADHEVILTGLHVLDAVNAAMEKGENVDHEDIRSLLTFLREFADGCHHVKEEAIFFPALMLDGMAFDEGPLRVMTYEHERGRALVSAMEDALGRNKKDEFLMYSKRYSELLSAHIEKETWILFQQAEQILTDDEDQRIAESLQHYDTVIVGAPNHERWRRTLQSLAAKYLTPAVVAHS